MENFCQPEVDQLGIELRINYNVLSFYVSMCNVERVKMLNCTDHLGKNLCSGYFGQGTVLVEIVEEFETLGQLHEDVDMRISPNSLINSDYVGVIELFMDKNLSP